MRVKIFSGTVMPVINTIICTYAHVNYSVEKVFDMYIFICHFHIKNLDSCINIHYIVLFVTNEVNVIVVILFDK